MGWGHRTFPTFFPTFPIATPGSCLRLRNLLTASAALTATSHVICAKVSI